MEHFRMRGYQKIIIFRMVKVAALQSHHPIVDYFSITAHHTVTRHNTVLSLTYLQIYSTSHHLLRINSTNTSLCFITLLFTLCIFYPQNNPEIFLIWENFTVWTWIKRKPEHEMDSVCLFVSVWFGWANRSNATWESPNPQT